MVNHLWLKCPNMHWCQTHLYSIRAASPPSLISLLLKTTTVESKNGSSTQFKELKRWNLLKQITGWGKRRLSELLSQTMLHPTNKILLLRDMSIMLIWNRKHRKWMYRCFRQQTALQMGLVAVQRAKEHLPQSAKEHHLQCICISRTLKAKRHNALQAVILTTQVHQTNQIGLQQLLPRKTEVLQASRSPSKEKQASPSPSKEKIT